VIATGVAMWLATDEPPRSSYRLVEARPAATGEVRVVSQAFVEFTDGGDEQRWVSYENHGHLASTRAELRALAEDAAAQDLDADVYADMRIAGHAVSREELLAAPHRIELSPELEARIPG
jgi:hypothetical protein